MGDGCWCEAGDGVSDSCPRKPDPASPLPVAAEAPTLLSGIRSWFTGSHTQWCDWNFAALLGRCGSFSLAKQASEAPLVLTSPWGSEAQTDSNVLPAECQRQPECLGMDKERNKLCCFLTTENNSALNK